MVSRCKERQSEVTFISHVFSREGMSPDPGKFLGMALVEGDLFLFLDYTFLGSMLPQYVALSVTLDTFRTFRVSKKI